MGQRRPGFSKLTVRLLGRCCPEDVTQIVPGIGTTPNPSTGVGDVGVDLNIVSPMKSVNGLIVQIDNANTKTLPAPFVTADLDTAVNNGFLVPKLSAALVMPIPKAVVGNFEGRKITLTITSRGTAADTITWTGGAAGWKWPSTTIGLGPLQADFDAALAAMANNDVILVGAEFHTLINAWLIQSVAGPFTP